MRTAKKNRGESASFFRGAEAIGFGLFRMERHRAKDRERGGGRGRDGALGACKHKFVLSELAAEQLQVTFGL